MTRTSLPQEPLGTLRVDAQHRSQTFLDDVDRFVRWDHFRGRLAALYAAGVYAAGGRPAHDPCADAEAGVRSALV